MEGFLDRETDKKAIRGGFIEWGVRSTAQPKAPSREIYFADLSIDFAVSSRAAICSIEQETTPAMPNVSAIGDRDMYDNIPTEEQKRGKRIYRRYIFYFVATITVLLLLFNFIPKPFKIHSALWALACIGCFSLASWIAIRLFAKSISADDVEVLKKHRHVGMTVSDVDTIGKIVSTYESNKVSLPKD